MSGIFLLNKSYVDEIIAQALAEAPDECCGILAGVEGKVVKLYRATNKDHSPYRYTIEPTELIAFYRDMIEKGWELLAVYHSHTHTEAFPSPTDIESALPAQTVYLIVSLADSSRPAIRGFHIDAGRVTEVELRIGAD
jgi:[CysO sulfur-carrier protein]-S-L-cysteine hydrolase